jgi:predicted branched-subunit amino acid permease
MSYSAQCGLGFVFSAVFLILFFAVRFRNAANEARTNAVALQAHGASHNYSVVAIVLAVLAVVATMFLK